MSRNGFLLRRTGVSFSIVEFRMWGIEEVLRSMTSVPAVRVLVM